MASFLSFNLWMGFVCLKQQNKIKCQQNKSKTELLCTFCVIVFPYYTFKIFTSNMSFELIFLLIFLENQVRLGQVRIGQISLDQDRLDQNRLDQNRLSQDRLIKFFSKQNYSVKRITVYVFFPILQNTKKKFFFFFFFFQILQFSNYFSLNS